MLACQEPTKEPSKPKQARKSPPKEEKVRKKITFEDIKDRFLHKNLKTLHFDREKFGKQLFSLSDTSKHTITRAELEDLGMEKSQPQFYLAHALHEFKTGYLLCLARRSEVFTLIDCVITNLQGTDAKHCFSLRFGGDAGSMANDFAFLNDNKIDIHIVENMRGDMTHKQYSLHISPTFELKADTLQTLKQKDPQYNLFKEILQKYGLPSF
jgi:hypothetical protein